MVIVPDCFPSAEAHRARSRHSSIPRCDTLRLCSLAMVATQLVMTKQLPGLVDLGLLVRAEFVLIGYFLTSFLLRDRGEAEARSPEGLTSHARMILQALPTSHILGVVAVILYLPQLLAIERIPAPVPAEWPALIERGLRSGMADFLRGSVDGRSLVALPFLVLLMPARLLGMSFLGFLGCGLAVQFSSLFSGEVRSASIFVDASAIDLLSLGALASAIVQGFGRSSNGPIARWALVMGLALALASIGMQHQEAVGHSGHWGSIVLLPAPPGFGVLNFILKIMATTLVGSLAWRDVGH